MSLQDEANLGAFFNYLKMFTFSSKNCNILNIFLKKIPSLALNNRVQGNNIFPIILKSMHACTRNTKPYRVKTQINHDRTPLVEINKIELKI